MLTLMINKCLSFQDLEKLIDEKCLLNMVNNLLWIKKERRDRVVEGDVKVLEGDLKVGEGEERVAEVEEMEYRRGKEFSEKMRRGEEVWREMWGREIKSREESKLLINSKLQVNLKEQGCLLRQVCSFQLSTSLHLEICGGRSWCITSS